MLSDPLFRSSGYGNTNLAQLPYLSQIFDMSYLAWGWSGLEPTYGELKAAYPNVEFYPAIGEYHGRDVIHHVIKKADPDVLLLHGDIYMFANTMQDHLSQYRGKICQIAMYPIDGEGIPDKWIPFMDKLDGLITLTEFGKKETEKVLKAPVRVANLGIDPKLFNPVNSDQKKILRQDKFKFMINKFVITWIGRNFSRKNPGLAVAGFANWVKKAKIKDAILYMHCADDDPAGSSINELIRKNYPHVSDLVYLPGNFNISQGFDRKTLAQLIQCSDVGLNTSLGEGWGMPLTETMACGVPMIAPAHSACMEQIGYGEERGELIKIAASFHSANNILQHIGDVSSLSNKLDILYSNQNRWVKKAKAGHEWASQMTWERSSNQLSEAIIEFHNRFANEIPRSKLEVL